MDVAGGLVKPGTSSPARPWLSLVDVQSCDGLLLGMGGKVPSGAGGSSCSHQPGGWEIGAGGQHLPLVPLESAGNTCWDMLTTGPFQRGRYKKVSWELT